MKESNHGKIWMLEKTTDFFQCTMIGYINELMTELPTAENSIAPLNQCDHICVHGDWS